jgi:sugar phosphate isomerase/epimerase
MVVANGEFYSGCGSAPREPSDAGPGPEIHELLRLVHVNMPWQFMRQYIPMALDLGMNLEIGFGAEDLDGAPFSSFQSAVRKLRERGSRITLHGPFWDLSPGSVDARIRETSCLRLMRFIDAAELLSPVQMVCHTGFDPRHHKGHSKLWIENSLAVWEPLVRRAEKLKAPLLLENVWEKDPGLHEELLRRIDSPWFGFCLDVGHQHCFSDTSMGVWLETMSPFLKEAHLHDNDGSGDSHLPPGHGSIDFNSLFEFFAAGASIPVLTLEPHCSEHLLATVTALNQMRQSGPATEVFRRIAQGTA